MSDQIIISDLLVELPEKEQQHQSGGYWGYYGKPWGYYGGSWGYYGRPWGWGGGWW